MWALLLCYSGTVWEPITQIGGADKGPLPLVQMSKAFMKIPNVIQPDPTNKDLLYFTQTQSESLWSPPLSPSLLIDKQLREIADCSVITTKCCEISIRNPRVGTLQRCQRGSVRCRCCLRLCFAVCTGILIVSLMSRRAQTRVCSYSGLLTLSFSCCGLTWRWLTGLGGCEGS